MSQKLPVSDFKWVEVASQNNEDYIKNYSEDTNTGYFIEVDVQYPQKLHEVCNYLPFLPERMKIEKTEKLVANLHDKEEYVIDIRNLKQSLNHVVALKKVHRVNRFNQKALLKSYIDMNTELIKNPKMKKIF